MVGISGAIYLLDVEGYLGREPNFSAIRSVMGDNKEIWLDIGARRASDATDCLILGAEKTFLNTRNLAGFEEIEKARELSDSIGVTFDLDQNGVVRGFPGCRLESLLGRTLQMGIEVIIMTHLRFPIERLMSYLTIVEKVYLCGSFGNFDAERCKGLIKEV